MRRGAGSSDLTTRATHTGLVWSRPTGYRVDRTRCLCSTSGARNRARTVCRRRTNEIARCDPGGDAVVSGGGCRELPGQGDRGRGRRHIHDGIEDRTSARPDLRNRCAGTRPARLRTRCRRALEYGRGKLVPCLLVGEGTVCDGKSKPTSRDRVVAQCFLDKLGVAEKMAKLGTV